MKYVIQKKNTREKDSYFKDLFKPIEGRDNALQEWSKFVKEGRLDTVGFFAWTRNGSEEFRLNPI